MKAGGSKNSIEMLNLFIKIIRNMAKWQNEWHSASHQKKKFAKNKF